MKKAGNGLAPGSTYASASAEAFLLCITTLRRTSVACLCTSPVQENAMAEQKSTRECARCGRRLDVGMDAIVVQTSVVGVRSLVPFAEPRLYCDEKCLRREDENDTIIRMRRRIP